MIYSVYVRKSSNYTDIDNMFPFYQYVVTTVYVNHFIASSVSLTIWSVALIALGDTSLNKITSPKMQ